MKYVYFDESGDLGFNISKPSTSRYFYVVFLVCDNYRPIEKVIKNAILSLPKSRRGNFYGYLHAVDEFNKTIYKVLLALSKKDIQIHALRVDKSKHIARYVNEKHDTLYIRFVTELIKKINFTDLGGLRFTLSRMFIKKTQNEKLIEKVRTAVSSCDVNVEVKRSMDDKCLQAVDFVAWAVNRKYELGDDELYELIAEKVVKIYEI
jgi:hypothetical protein